MSQAPGHVVLHLYHAKNKRHEQYHALVLSSREVEKHVDPVLTIAYFDHLNTSAHHALQGIDWAETLDRVLDVASINDAEGAPFYYEDIIGSLQDCVDRYVRACNGATQEIQRLQKELAETTEGKDKALQAVADANARFRPQLVPTSTETKHYADGSSATGPAPLPDHSPEGAPSVADLDAVAAEQEVAKATEGE